MDSTSLYSNFDGNSFTFPSLATPTSWTTVVKGKKKEVKKKPEEKKYENIKIKTNMECPFPIVESAKENHKSLDKCLKENCPDLYRVLSDRINRSVSYIDRSSCWCIKFFEVDSQKLKQIQDLCEVQDWSLVPLETKSASGLIRWGSERGGSDAFVKADVVPSLHVSSSPFRQYLKDYTTGEFDFQYCRHFTVDLEYVVTLYQECKKFNVEALINVVPDGFSEVYCWRCFELGHASKDCTTKGSKCPACGKGHILAHCRERKVGMCDICLKYGVDHNHYTFECPSINTWIPLDQAYPKLFAEPKTPPPRIPSAPTSSLKEDPLVKMQHDITMIKILLEKLLIQTAR